MPRLSSRHLAHSARSIIHSVMVARVIRGQMALLVVVAASPNLRLARACSRGCVLIFNYFVTNDASEIDKSQIASC